MMNIRQKQRIEHYRASSSANRGVVGVVEPLRGDAMTSFGAKRFA